MEEQLETAKILKRPLVLWSGGFDSTMLVIDLLQKGDIDVMYIDLDNNYTIQRREKRAVKKLKVIIADANLPGKIVNEFAYGYDTIEVTKSLYAMPALWVNAAAFLASPAHHSSVNIGYVKHDDAWHYKTDIINAYKALYTLVSDDGSELVPLEFPYEWNTKKQILDSLKDFMYLDQVLTAIRYCEEDTKEQCGKCSSCVRHAKELELDETSRFMKVDMTDEYKEFCKQRAEA